MTQTSPTLRQYELIASLSDKMVRLARQNDWESVVSVGQQYINAVEHLKALTPLDDDDRLARKPYLTKILNDDARIRHMVAPELERLGGLLGTMKRQQHVADAYLAPPKIRS
ncbi:MAG: flagellar protein FliT [Alcaligenaceae bacterium]|nr:flagellar protein FliT [Alcaligenaceae bacterium]